MKLITKSGATKNIIISKFGAMEGWDIQQRFVEFAMSKDTAFRMAYTMQILSFAAVDIPGAEPIQLKTNAFIENHLEDWTGIKQVFETVLRENGIEPTTHAEREHYWAHAGGELATAFIVQATELLGPIMAAQANKE